MFGTAGLPHILMRFYTVPDAKAARKSVFYATGLIGFFYLLTFILGFGAMVLVGPDAIKAVDKGGNIHAPIGKVSFAVDALETNFTALMDQVVRARPAASKGVYIRNVAISSTMGPGITIDTTPYRA